MTGAPCLAGPRPALISMPVRPLADARIPLRQIVHRPPTGRMVQPCGARCATDGIRHRVPQQHRCYKISEEA